jgi:hypothetical protein
MLIVVFISVCHQQVDHIHEEEEKDDNSCKILVYMQCLASSVHCGPPMKGWTPPEFQVLS